MTLLFVPQIRLYVGLESADLSGWWLDTGHTGAAFRCHLGRVLVEIG